MLYFTLCVTSNKLVSCQKLAITKKPKRKKQDCDDTTVFAYIFQDKIKSSQIFSSLQLQIIITIDWVFGQKLISAAKKDGWTRLSDHMCLQSGLMYRGFWTTIASSNASRIVHSLKHEIAHLAFYGLSDQPKFTRMSATVNQGSNCQKESNNSTEEQVNDLSWPLSVGYWPGRIDMVILVKNKTSLHLAWELQTRVASASEDTSWTSRSLFMVVGMIVVENRVS